jgi:hypothetical protein
LFDEGFDVAAWVVVVVGADVGVEVVAGVDLATFGQHSPLLVPLKAPVLCEPDGQQLGE